MVLTQEKRESFPVTDFIFDIVENDSVSLQNEVPPTQAQQAQDFVSHKEEIARTKENRRMKYSDELKKEAVALALKLNNNSKAAEDIKKKYSLQKLDESSIREWIATSKYCKDEEVFKDKRKSQVRDAQAKMPELDDHMKAPGSVLLSMLLWIKPLESASYFIFQCFTSNLNIAFLSCTLDMETITFDLLRVSIAL